MGIKWTLLLWHCVSVYRKKTVPVIHWRRVIFFWYSWQNWLWRYRKRQTMFETVYVPTSSFFIYQEYISCNALLTIYKICREMFFRTEHLKFSILSIAYLYKPVISGSKLCDKSDNVQVSLGNSLLFLTWPRSRGSQYGCRCMSWFDKTKCMKTGL